MPRRSRTTTGRSTWPTAIRTIGSSWSAPARWPPRAAPPAPPRPGGGEWSAGKRAAGAGARAGWARVSALCSAAARRDGKLAAADRDRLAERHAARAVALLGKAHAAGDFKDPARVKQMTDDPDLA